MQGWCISDVKCWKNPAMFLWCSIDVSVMHDKYFSYKYIFSNIHEGSQKALVFAQILVSAVVCNNMNIMLCQGRSGILHNALFFLLCTEIYIPHKLMFLKVSLFNWLVTVLKAHIPSIFRGIHAWKYSHKHSTLLWSTHRP